MLLSKNTTSEIVTYGEGANNVRNAIPWSGISDKEIGRYTVTAEYCPVQINVGMPKNPYPLSLADSGVRIIRIRSNQEVPDYFTDPSEKSTDEHLRLSFKENGGTIKAVVGIDQGNTSYEALISLLSVCNELYIYHSEDFMRTFYCIWTDINTIYALLNE